VNIGYSCKLLTEDMEEFTVDGDTFESVKTQLTQAMDEIVSTQKKLNQYVVDTPGSPPTPNEDVTYTNGSLSMRPVPVSRQAPQPLEEFGGFALVISGQSLVS